MSQLPDQPLYIDGGGVTRFVPNRIVVLLLDIARQHGISLNTISAMPFTADERSQFVQLIGYSLSGYGDLSYVTDENWIRASTQPVTAMKVDE